MLETGDVPGITTSNTHNPKLNDTMKKEPMDIINEQIYKLSDDLAFGWLKENCWLAAQDKPAILQLETYDDFLCGPKIAKFKKKFDLNKCIDSIYGDCGPDEKSIKVTEAWGRWLKRAGEDFLQKASEERAKQNQSN